MNKKSSITLKFANVFDKGRERIVYVVVEQRNSLAHRIGQELTEAEVKDLIDFSASDIIVRA